MTEHYSKNDDDHAPVSKRPHYEDIDVPMIFMVGVISAIVTFLVIGFVQGLSYRWENAYVRERTYDVVNKPVRELIDDQKSLLSNTVDSKGETVPGRIAINDAIKVVLQRYGRPDNAGHNSKVSEEARSDNTSSKLRQTEISSK
jgi:uncharacterized membrane protein YcgQ (UPF0703/DUF1980 family)